MYQINSAKIWQGKTMREYVAGINQATSDDVTRLKSIYGLCDGDLAHIKALGATLHGKVTEVIAQFYVWLEQQPVWEVFFSEAGKADKLKILQTSYWQEFFRGEITVEYIQARRKIGGIHAQIGLSLSDYFASMAVFQNLFLKQFESVDPKQLMALNRLLMMDAGIVVEAFNLASNQTIADQSKAMMEMSTPVTAIWENILLLPIVGIIDSSRAQDIMDSMLNRVAELQTKVFILDISGVAVVDTAVANHIIKMTNATQLMGCQCVISGISPSIAQTMVELGISVGRIKTTSNLKDALKYAFSETGVSIVASERTL
ncbi:MAG: rsbT co-antagonist protein RsbR [Phenylobacterium sp.]|jgi:rsbT co-antagonist protein RsbR